jgi:dihydrofolate reductase
MTGEGIDNTIIISDNISNDIKKIKRQTGKDILIFGSPSVAQTLMKLELIDSFWIFINPIIFGQGIPLFSGKAEKSKLKLLATSLFSNGEIALNYVVDR